MEESQAEAEGHSSLQGLHYNHNMLSFLRQQLERVESLEQPASATAEEWLAFHTRVKKARRLLAKHSEPFDIRTFYKIEDVYSAVGETCEFLHAQAQEWKLQCAAELEYAVPYDCVQADREYLHKLLSYILKGEKCGVDDELLHQWMPIKCAHDELKSLLIISQDALLMKKQIGKGGYGLVFEAQWHFSRVAVKRPLTEGDLPIEEFASFVREVVVHANLSHPHIVQVHATTPSGWLVMEAADADLGTLCRGSKKMGWRGTLNLLRQASEGLYFLHSLSPPVVHADVKSSNFLVFGTDPDSCKVKIADFGLALEPVKGRSKTTRLGGGTLEWMAPESYEGQPVSVLSDVFGFGVVMYEAVARAHPYGADKLKLVDARRAFVMNKKLSGEEPCTVRPEDCPEEMRLLMKRCCSINPAARPTMMEVTQCLQELPADWSRSDQQLRIEVEAETQPQQLAQLNGDLNAVRQENVRLNEELAKKGMVIRKMESEVSELECTVSELRQLIRDSKNEAATLIEDREQENDYLRHLLDNATSRVDAAEATLAQFQELDQVRRASFSLTNFMENINDVIRDAEVTTPLRDYEDLQGFSVYDRPTVARSVTPTMYALSSEPISQNGLVDYTSFPSGAQGEVGGSCGEGGDY